MVQRGLRRAPGFGAEFHRSGDVRVQLPGGGMEALPGADLGATLGHPPRGLAQAVRGGLEGRAPPGAGTACRLVRIHAL